MLEHPIPVRVTANSKTQIANQARWWRKHRSDSRYSFEDRIDQIKELLSSWPWRGGQASDVQLENVRRISVPGVSHWLYYRVVLDDHNQPMRIDILAVWHFRKADQPPLDG